MAVKELKKVIKSYLKCFFVNLFEKYLIDEEYFIEKYNNKFPKVKTVQQTINELINTKKSIVRFGDGELEIIEGNDILFQKSTPQLSDRLIEVLSSNEKDIL